MEIIETDLGELLMVDLHDFALWQAKERIREELNRAINRKLDGLYLIHGFNSGNRIKSYIRRGPLEKFSKK
jgi:hypothetical protein|tara:strand:- start:146 stop:358 length:213 start_codon:yes stop_codon:yes gene_type:complete